ncbi:MAG: hypothetical protein EA417_07005 [Gammaproteobacteria bacterium]|nr:MAG: hypothetical protein EA417_07005 [Gammaproteobacteria bacterium]
MPLLDAFNPKNWLPGLRAARDPIRDDDSPAEVDGWIRIYDSATLLSRPDIAQYVAAIERDIPIRPEHVSDLRTLLLRHVASMCQLLPASEYYHHSGPGGLLAHHLHCMYLAGTAQYQIHQLVDSKLYSSVTSEDVVYWTNFCFQVRALTHDLGKILTMLEITLRIEDKNGELDYQPFDPMFAGFLEYDLKSIAYQHYQRGARSVRYKYRFAKSGGIHDHEKYWEAAIHNLSSRFFGTIVPGKFISLHLTDTEDFVRFLKPKLQEIDQRSVEIHQQERRATSGRPTAVANILLSAISSHPRLDSCKLVVGDDGAPRLFVPYPFIQSLVNELPESYENSVLPRHPDQIIFSLKSAGCSDTCAGLPSNSAYIHQFEGLSGVFLHPDITDQLLGFRLRRSFVAGSSYSVSDLANSACPSVGPIKHTSAFTESPASASLPTSADSARFLGAVSAPDAFLDDDAMPPQCDPHEATRDALLNLAPQTASSFKDRISDALPPRQEPVTASDMLSADSSSDGTSASSRSNSSVSNYPNAHPSVSAVTDFLLATRSSFVDNPKFSRVESGRLILNDVFIAHLFSQLRSQRIYHRNNIRNFRRRFAEGHSGYWSLSGEDLVCTPSFSTQLLSVIDSPPPPEQSSAPSRAVAADPSIFDVLPSISSEDVSDDVDIRSPAGDEPERELRAQLPSFNPGASPGEILSGVLKHAYTLPCDGQSSPIEYDGQLVRISFTALDAYTGHRKLRGKVIEALQKLGIYSTHIKATAVLITDTHPEVQSCLVDLQLKR